MQLVDFDLNLLKTLDALLDTRSVTRAAQRLGLTQPALSHALARLRTALNDPLLVREGAAHVLTQRGHALVEPVKEALHRAELVLAGAEPVPLARLRRNFVLSLADYSELVLLPALTATLSREAPGLSLTCSPHLHGAMEALQAGADVWIGPRPEERPGLYAQKVTSDSYLCLARKGHPALKQKLTVERFAALRHLQIAPGGAPGGPLDDALAERGLSRQVAVRVPHFLVAPLLVERSDLVLTAPRRLVEKFVSLAKVHVFEPPLPIPGFTLKQAWLARHHDDPVHRWLRSEIRRAL